MTKFEKIKIGERAEIKHVVTQQDLDKFVALTGDDNKLHIDEEFAARTAFKKPVVHGMLGASFISTIIGTKLPGDGSLWFSQNLEFLLPVRIGDELTIRAEVIKKVENLQIIELQTDVLNQDKQKVTTGVAKIKIVEEEVPKVEMAPDLSNQGRLALVVGATGGIGSQTCLSLAKEGYDLFIHYHSNLEFANRLKEEVQKFKVRAELISGDIAKESDIETIVESIERKFGYLSVVINCATHKIANIKFQDLDWADLQKHFDINVKGNFHFIKN
jgi:3-oxoacyl-[acyl-carrier protein] reductase